MSRIPRAFARARADGRAAVLPYLCAGDPSLAATARHLRALDGVADLVEVGVPFSDPVADGPVIQGAADRARRRGATLAKTLVMIARLRHGGLRMPVALMTYYNPVHRMGLEAFSARAAAAGVDGVIVPDLPVEESAPLRAACRRRGVDLVLLAAPTSTPARLRRLTAASSGFVYHVAVEGVTGERRRVARSLAADLRRLRRATRLPIAVGFGVASPAHARAVAAAGADGVVVGSAVVRRVAAGASPRALAAFVSSLRRAARRPRRG